MSYFEDDDDELMIDDDNWEEEEEEDENDEQEDEDQDEYMEGGGDEDGNLSYDEEEDEDEKDKDKEKDEEKDEEDEYEDEEGEGDKKKKQINIQPQLPTYDDDDDDDDGEEYLQKFDQTLNENYILNFHPESVIQNYDEILTVTNVVRDDNNNIIDGLHKTVPFLTKYERARIIGARAKQINAGAAPFVKVPENVIDGYVIAEMELEEKKIPYIIRRPLPNGGSEYWRLKDLENIAF